MSVSDKAEYHCKYYKDAHFRCGLASFFAGASQDPHTSTALPHPLLTSCCVRAWQDRSRAFLQASPRSRALSWPTGRAVHAGVRLMGVRGRCEVRGVAIGVMSITLMHTNSSNAFRISTPV